MSALLVTADDFGLCPATNDAVCFLHDRGVLPQASLLVGTPHFAESVAALARRPGLAVGVHLNLTDGVPTLPAREVPTLVGADGRFPGGRHLRVAARILTRRISPEEVHAEWRAQIRAVVDAGVAVRHLNGHGHLHLLPPLHGAVADLLEEFSIPFVRLVLAAEPSSRGLVLGRWSRRLRARLERRGLATRYPDRVLGLGRQGSVDEGFLRRRLARGWSGTAELIVHPSLGANPFHRRWNYAGETETRDLARVLTPENA